MCLADSVVVDDTGLVLHIPVHKRHSRRAQSGDEPRELTDADFVYRPDVRLIATDLDDVTDDVGESLRSGSDSGLMLAWLLPLLLCLPCCCCCYFVWCRRRPRDEEEADKMQYRRRGGMQLSISESFRKRFSIGPLGTSGRYSIEVPRTDVKRSKTIVQQTSCSASTSSSIDAVEAGIVMTTAVEDVPANETLTNEMLATEVFMLLRRLLSTTDAGANGDVASLEAIALLRARVEQLDVQLHRRLLDTTPTHISAAFRESMARLDHLEQYLLTGSQGTTGDSSGGGPGSGDDSEAGGGNGQIRVTCSNSIGDGNGGGDGVGDYAGNDNGNGTGDGGAAQLANLQVDLDAMIIKVQRRVVSTVDISLPVQATDTVVEVVVPHRRVVSTVNIGMPADAADAEVEPHRLSLLSRVFSSIFSIKNSERHSQGSARHSTDGSKRAEASATGDKMMRVKKWATVKPPPPPPGRPPQEAIAPHSRAGFFHIFGGLA